MNIPPLIYKVAYHVNILCTNWPYLCCEYCSEFHPSSARRNIWVLNIYIHTVMWIDLICINIVRIDLITSCMTKECCIRLPHLICRSCTTNEFWAVVHSSCACCNNNVINIVNLSSIPAGDFFDAGFPTLTPLKQNKIHVIIVPSLLLLADNT